MHSEPIKHPLPEGWAVPTFVEDVVVVERLALHRSGVVSSGPDGVEVTGSAASVQGSCCARSYFELLERVSTLESMKDGGLRQLWTRDRVRAGEASAAETFPVSDEPSRWRYAKSNGVALHVDWSTACYRALCELVERDRVLRSWYGETRPRRLAREELGLALATSESYEVRAYEFLAPSADALCGDELAVAGVFGFPRRGGVPFVSGYGARANLPSALAAALGEALQMLAFVSGEEIPAQEPAREPTPLAHLDHLLWPERHELLKGWLEGDHLPFGGGSRRVAGPHAAPLFVDLTPSWLAGGLMVAKAISGAAAPLAFGDAPFAQHLPPALRIHPIP